MCPLERANRSSWGAPKSTGSLLAGGEMLGFATPANAAHGHQIRDSTEPEQHSSALRASLAHHQLPSLLKGINFLFGFINLHTSRPEACALHRKI